MDKSNYNLMTTTVKKRYISVNSKFAIIGYDKGNIQRIRFIDKNYETTEDVRKSNDFIILSTEKIVELDNCFINYSEKDITNE